MIEKASPELRERTRQPVRMFSVHMPPEADEMVLGVLHSGYIGQGPQVDRFERELASLLAVRSVVTVNSGTSALQLALRLAGAGPGTEVITTPMTCGATNLPILAAGATPVWADIDPLTGLIDPDSVRRLLSPATKAIMLVDWGGNPCRLDAIQEIARSAGVATIQDAAQALGAVYKGRGIATWSDFTCFSFQAIKQITTGDGGAIVCRRPEDDERARRLRWYGIPRQGTGNHWDKDIEDWGYKFHMNDIAATLGLAQMRHIERILERAAANVAYYEEHLSPYFVRSIDRARDEAEGTRSANWLYTVLLPNAEVRTKFVQHMAERGVDASTVHRRNDVLAAFRTARSDGLSGVDQFSCRQISLPVHAAVSADDLAWVVAAANEFAAART